MKDTDEANFCRMAMAAVQTYLAEVPFCTLLSAEPNVRTAAGELDAVLKVRLPDGDRSILVEAKRNGQPRNAREALNYLSRFRAEYPTGYGVFVAPYVTPQTAELIQQDGAGYVDLSGNGRLCFDGVYIRREGAPNKSTKRADLRSLYSPKAERVLRALLLEPRRAWKIESIADAGEVSLGQASNVKKLLDDREWLKRQADGIVLTQPATLLEEWAGNYRFSRNTSRDFFSLDPMPQIEAKVAAACRDSELSYGLTGFSSAARLAPMVRYQRGMAYVNGDITEIAQKAGLKEVTSGANMTLIDPYDAGVLTGRQEVDGIYIVSAIQTYLDLLQIKGRGKEAAEAVLAQKIRPTW